MDYFLLATMGDLNDQSLSLVENKPEGIGLHAFCLARGEKARPHLPEDAKVFLSPKSRGLKLPGILGNTECYFIGSAKVKEIVQKHCAGQEIEYLPFTLYNQKKRVHSKDYYFINPIGGFDCLDEPSCEIKYDDDGDIVTFKKLNLDAAKMADAPHLFRILKIPTKYVISKTLVQAFKDDGVTNLLGNKLVVK
jgi:hypothetical protein